MLVLFHYFQDEEVNLMIILLVLAFLVCHMCLIWIWYRVTNNPSVVDVGWASALTLSGLIYLAYPGLNFRQSILALLLVVWGVRLGGYLWWTRIRHKIVDKRYLTLSNDWKIAKPLGFFLNFQLQGILALLISSVWYFAAQVKGSSLSWIDWLALGWFLIALALETVADHQLQQFKKSNPGQVCNVKLWAYSRHPNYFFEWLIWCAFTLFALQTPLGWIAVISPITLYLIMTQLTAPLTEKGSLESRGKRYEEYQKVTPLFFPKFHNH